MARNRAKCKNCQEIIEVIDNKGYVECSCKEIGIGADLYVAARDWNNFLRLEEDDQEKDVQYQDKNKKDPEDNPKPFTKQELLDELKKTAEIYANVPPQIPVMHHDISVLLTLLFSIFKADSDS